MKLEDLKFRYIIPIDEKDEQGEPCYLFDRKRTVDHDDPYRKLFCGEATVYVGLQDETEELKIPDHNGITFPDEATDSEKFVCLTSAQAAGMNEENIQKFVDDYFKEAKLDIKNAELERHSGFPW